jgi:signal transduction histidine kinase
VPGVACDVDIGFNPSSATRPRLGAGFVRPILRPGVRLPVGSAVVAGAITLVISLTPTIHFAYRRPVLNVGLETAESLVALLLTYLLIGRVRRTRALGDALFAVGVAALAVAKLAMVAPALASEDAPTTVASWMSVTIRLVGAGFLATAPWLFLSNTRLDRKRLAWVAGGGAAAILVAAAVPWTLEDVLPPVARPEHLVAAAATRGLVGHPAVIAIQLASMAAFALAAVGFARRGVRNAADPMAPWVSGGAVFAAFGSLNYVLFPTLYSQWVYTGDVLRFAFYAMLLIGGAREIRSYWRNVGLVAAHEERRRLARDLHDGLAQEIAYIARAAKVLREPTGADDVPARIEAAAVRAQLESRQLIAALAAPVGAPFAMLLEEVAHDAAARFAVEMALEVDTSAHVDSAYAEPLLRIAAEAVTNAARHSGAAVVRVRLASRRGRVELQVRDDGKGFLPEPDAGFGIRSMRERADAVGAALAITSAPGAGTSVEVIL